MKCSSVFRGGFVVLASVLLLAGVWNIVAPASLLWMSVGKTAFSLVLGAVITIVLMAES